jgi:protein-S-isoprenylcysteine O-methyltransferase Ste14
MWLLLKVPLVNLLILFVLLGWLPWQVMRGATLPATWTAQHFAALPLLVGGGLLWLQCVWYLGAVGRGTPAPFDAPCKLVQRGPYRRVRNPLYLAFMLIAAGEAVFFLHLWLALYAVALASALQLVVVIHEEEAMRRRFGALYSDYCNLVPRWWPRARAESTSYSRPQ